MPRSVFDAMFLSAFIYFLAQVDPSANFKWTCSSVESERDSAKVEVARSNRARSTNNKSYLDLQAGVAQWAGGASLRN